MKKRTHLASDVLEHLDAEERVERVRPRGGDVAVVHEVHAHAPDEAARADALLRERLLLDGQRERVDFAAVRGRGLESQKPP